MSEISNDIKARVFGLYLGAKVIYGYDGRRHDGKLEGINEKGEAIIFDPSFVFNHYRYVRFDLVQLVLRPLEKITDEHCVEVFNLDAVADDREENNEFKAAVGRTWVEENVLSYQMADFLRSKGYALPYGDVKDLFAAGIAVEEK